MPVDEKITQLPDAVIPLQSTDLFVIVQDVSTTPETRGLPQSDFINDLATYFVGASINLFLDNTASDISGYKTLTGTIPAGGQVNDSASITAADTVINEYASAAALFTFIPAQVVSVHLHMAQTAGTKTSTAYIKLFHRTAGGTETLMGTSTVHGPIEATEHEHNFDASVLDTNFSSTDRFVMKVFASPSGAGTDPTVNVYFQGTTNSRVAFNGSASQTGSGAAADGWNTGTGTWSYTSADSPVFVASVPDADAALINVGDRFKLTQTTVKYFIVHAKGSPSGGFTPVTIYGGTDYTLANAAITSPFWSHAKSPLGFPMSPGKWFVELTNTSQLSQANPTASTWYNLGSLSIAIPIGAWRGYFEVFLEADITGTAVDVYGTLSTANNTESDNGRTTGSFAFSGSSGAIRAMLATSKQLFIELAAKTTHYLNCRTTTSSVTFIYFRGDLAKTIIRLYDAYL